MVRIIIEDEEFSTSQITKLKRKFDNYFSTDFIVSIDEYGVVFNG
jgi:hypothetical protein